MSPSPTPDDQARKARNRRLLLALALLAVNLVWVGVRRGAPDKTNWKPSLVILLAIDTLRPDYVGCYGTTQAITPNIDALAREGLVFEQAYSQSNRTLVSFSSILTGLYPPLFTKRTPEQEAWDVAQHYPTLASVVASYGCKTAGFVTNNHLRSAFGFKHGFETYQFGEGSFRNSFGPALTWLDSCLPALRKHKPHLMLLHTNDVHSPNGVAFGLQRLHKPGYKGVATELEDHQLSHRYLQGHRYFAEARHARRPPPQGEARAHEPSVTLSDDDLSYLRSAYAGRVTYTDLYVGMLTQYLRKHHLEQDTLIVLFGDHGEWLLEDDENLGHGFDTRDALTHVPLILWSPGGVGQGRHIPQIVELCDIFPTVLDLWQLNPKMDLPGTSLAPLMRGADRVNRPAKAISLHPEAFVSRISIRTETYRYVRHQTPQGAVPLRDLFYVPDDPLQVKTLINDPRYTSLVKSLDAEMWERLPKKWCLVNE